MMHMAYETHCDLVMPHGDTDVGQYWSTNCWHQAIT